MIPLLHIVVSVGLNGKDMMTPVVWGAGLRHQKERFVPGALLQDLSGLALALGKCQPCLLIRPAGFALGGAVESPCQRRRNAGQSAPQGESECRRGGPKAVAFG